MSDLAGPGTVATGSPSRAGRDLPLAIVVGVVLLWVVGVSLLWRKELFVALAVLACGAGLWELALAFERRRIRLPLLPLLVASTSGETISVGPPWFTRVTAPIFIALLFLMGVGPALPWGTASWTTLRERFTVPLLIAAIVAAVALVLGLREPVALGTLALAVFVGGILLDEVVRGARARSRSRGESPPTAAWRCCWRKRIARPRPFNCSSSGRRPAPRWRTPASSWGGCTPI